MQIFRLDEIFGMDKSTFYKYIMGNRDPDTPRMQNKHSTICDTLSDAQRVFILNMPFDFFMSCFKIYTSS